ncbi:hypothetical protein TWF730_001877 [Orbilia blumenaviensis]|uniref:Uncharacterized protein n=1 Tax=Orbilia blumenaviensis TaxID=1796055 RepID=A0AAV9UGG1_9PEZI
MFLKPNRTSCKANPAMTSQLAALGTRTPRIRYTPPTLPPLPISKPGRDPLLDMDYLWEHYPECYRTAHLLYQPLIRTLIGFCPEIDWSKLTYWINHYKSRRRSRDFKSYLRVEDTESFIDYMLKYHPVKKLGDMAKVLDGPMLDGDLKVYFAKWDAILIKERARREVARLSQRQSSSSILSISTIAPPITNESKGQKQPPSAACQSAEGSSRPPSAEVVKKEERFELPEKRRLLITKFVEEGIERVTRAMIAIHKTLYGERPIPLSDCEDSDGLEQSTLVGIPLQPQTPAGEPDFGVPSAFDRENRVNLSTVVESEVTPKKLNCLPLSSQTTETDNSSSPSKPLSPQDKEAMRQYLAAHDKFKECIRAATKHVDGTSSQQSITTSFQQRLSEVKRPYSAFYLKGDYVSVASTTENPRLWQPKPVSPQTQAKLHSMGQYPVAGENNAQPTYDPLHPYATLPRANNAGTAGNIMHYVFDHAIPIGIETTPHIAMFANQRREKEREDSDTKLRRCV